MSLLVHGRGGTWVVTGELTWWDRSVVNEAAAASPVQPIVNMGQGFLWVLLSRMKLGKY